MKNINRILNIEVIGTLGVVAIIAALGELGILPNGVMGECYALEVAFMLITVLFIPVSLKMMSSKMIQKRVAGDERQYLCWATLRLVLVLFVVLAGVILYYIQQNTNMIYCAGIGLISLMYIWPTIGRMEEELQASKQCSEDDISK